MASNIPGVPSDPHDIREGPPGPWTPIISAPDYLHMNKEFILVPDEAGGGPTGGQREPGPGLRTAGNIAARGECQGEEVIIHPMVQAKHFATV